MAQAHPVARQVRASSDQVLAASPSRVRWRIFAIIFALTVINLVDRVSLSIAMPIIAKEFTLSPSMQGLILSSFFWAYALLQIPGGWLIDRYGPRRVIGWSTGLWGTFQTLAAFATGGLSLMFARVALGAAEAPLFPAGGKLNSLWLGSGERSRGAVLMDCGGPLGVALGGLLIAYMIAVLDSWRIAFFIAGIATLAMGWLAWHYLRDDPAAHPGVNEAELASINEGRSVPMAEAAQQAVKGLGIAARSLTGIMLGRASWAMVFFGLLTWGPSYLAQARGFDIKGIGAATFVIFLCGAAGSLTGGFLCDLLIRKGMRRGLAAKGLLTFSGLIALCAFLLLPGLGDPYQAVGLLSLTAFFLMWGSLYWSFPGLLASPARVGLIGGVMNLAGSLGGIAVPILVGLLLQHAGGYSAVLGFFAVCSGLFIAGTLLISLDQAEVAHG
ncbi:MFS transporter [Pseudomonas sp. 21LCFQ02]|uniref:MFS transporter n=1 Tax=unclassified Pseudomonas TaxID=196821 RepID=UPI0004F9243C|nr:MULTISPECIES: MFS transporter [unclassified Pseudomonas]MCO8167201.1 MFS transporter [Pseudomonas sp. 21LCFQ02]MCQ9422828.1 MFS transporter [Pseudomonas sp. LJDD11]BAP44030.1 major facilitator superfamily protein [Pseudomonas sp. StFLB209]